VCLFNWDTDQRAVTMSWSFRRKSLSLQWCHWEGGTVALWHCPLILITPWWESIYSLTLRLRSVGFVVCPTQGKLLPLFGPWFSHISQEVMGLNDWRGLLLNSGTFWRWCLAEVMLGKQAGSHSLDGEALWCHMWSAHSLRRSSPPQTGLYKKREFIGSWNWKLWV
jgi:hypothetical protein